LLEFRRDVAAPPLAVASLRRRPLMDSATMRLPAVEDQSCSLSPTSFMKV
jgi:hypothetical protein